MDHKYLFGLHPSLYGNFVYTQYAVREFFSLEYHSLILWPYSQFYEVLDNFVSIKFDWNDIKSTFVSVFQYFVECQHLSQLNLQKSVNKIIQN